MGLIELGHDGRLQTTEFGSIEAILGSGLVLQRYAELGGNLSDCVWRSLIPRGITATGRRDWSLITLCGRRGVLSWEGSVCDDGLTCRYSHFAHPVITLWFLGTESRRANRRAKKRRKPQFYTVLSDGKMQQNLHNLTGDER